MDETILSRSERMDKMSLRIETINFNRKKGGPWEQGVLINGGDGPIIDMKGQAVPPGEVWDWRQTHAHVMTVLDPLIEAQREQDRQDTDKEWIDGPVEAAIREAKRPPIVVDDGDDNEFVI